jgi:hypothetical protein
MSSRMHYSLGFIIVQKKLQRKLADEVSMISDSIYNERVYAIGQVDAGETPV